MTNRVCFYNSLIIIITIMLMDNENAERTETEEDPLLVVKNRNEKKEDTTRVVIDHRYHHPKHSVFDDIKEILKLGVPIFFAMVSWTGMKTTDTALLGHVSADALSASALSDLWTMCTSVLIQGRVLGILCGSAIGAGNPKLAGVYLQVSFAILSFVSIFVFVSWYLTEYVWILMGSDRAISHMAGYYAKVLAWSIPGRLGFSQLSQFFSSQRIMHPEVTVASIALISNLLLGLLLVLGVPGSNFNGFGFTACPIVTTTIVYVQLFVLWFVFIHIKKLHEPCWDGWKRNELTRERIWTFSELYFPAAFGLASDFWRVAVIGGVAAELGNVEVAVFNTSYRIMWIVLILVNAVSNASGIIMSLRLGEMNPNGAKQAGAVCVFMVCVLLSVVGIAVCGNIRVVGRIFTNDEPFLDLLEESRYPFSVTLVLMNLAVALERIPYTMGRTKEVFVMGVIASWGAQVPAVLFCTRYWHSDLAGLYSGMAIGYFVLVFLYGWITITSDWQRYADIARDRSEVS